MNQHLKAAYARVLSPETIHTIERIVAYGECTAVSVMNMEIMRDRLNEACLLFESMNSTEEFEDLYLLLFDALALITDALSFKKRRHELLLVFLKTIERIRMEGGNP